MGEYVKYRGEQTKIGTCEDMFYTSFQKYIKVLESGKLSKSEGSLPPEEYVKPDSGNRFRFPFPDEDKLPFGDIVGSFERGVPIKVSYSDTGDDGNVQKRSYELEVVRQKLIHREEDGKLCLVVVCRDKETGDMFRIDSDGDVKKFIGQMMRNHIINAQDPGEKQFYKDMASRMLKGYHLDGHVQKIAQKLPAPPVKRDLKARKSIKR